jgi:hypothetical protein
MASMASIGYQLLLVERFVQEGRSAFLTQIPWGGKCAIPWSIGKKTIGSRFLGMIGKVIGEKIIGSAILSMADQSDADIHITGSDSVGSGSSSITSDLNEMVNEHPSGECVKFDTDVSKVGSPSWAVCILAPTLMLKYVILIIQHTIITFCMACPYLCLEVREDDTILSFLPKKKKQEILRDATVTLTWTASRYLELCLFRYLQRVSNDLTDRSSENEKAYIICMFQILLLNGGITSSILEMYGLVSHENGYISFVY